MPVTSSALRSVGYDPQSRRLHVEFHGTDENGQLGPGRVAEYANVPQSTADALMKAPSLGQFFHKHIKSKPDKHPWSYVA